MAYILSPLHSPKLRRSWLHCCLRHQSLQLLVCCLFVNFVYGLDKKTLQDVEKMMEEQGIKEIIDKPAEYLIDLSYDNGKYPVKVGDKVDINKLFEQPSSVSWEAELGEWFSLVLFDYDAPERRKPELRSFVHWMIGNIPEKSLTAAHTLYEYYGLKLFEEKDVHRYVMFIYKQKEKIVTSGNMEGFREPYINNQAKSVFHEFVNPDNLIMTDALRAFFNHTEFEEKYKFGPPYAMTFFTAELGKS